MANRSVAVTLTANVSGFVASMGKAAASAADTGNKITKAVEGKSESLDKIGNAALGMGGVMLAGVGLAVKSFADFDQQMSAVQSSTHETDANMSRLRETAMKLGADTAFSATEAAQGMDELAKAGVSTNDIIGGGLKGSLDLAAAGSLSVAESAEIAATALTQFKLKGSDVGHVADLLAAGAGKAQGSVHDMGEALKQSGLVASQYGLSIEETTGTLAAFASAGLVGSDAGTSFKTMLMSLAAPSKQSANLMAELGLSAYDSSGGFVTMEGLAGQLQDRLGGLSEEQRNSALATIFGTDAVRGANVLYSQGATGIADWTAKVNDQGYAAETAGLKMDNLKGDLEKLGGAFETMMIGFGSGADGPLRDIVQSITRVVDKFGELPAGVQQGLTAVTGIAGVSALAAGGILKATTSAAGLVTAFQDLRPAAEKVRGKLSDITNGSTKIDGALRGIGAAAGIAGLALAGVAIAMQVQKSMGRDFKADVDDLAGSLMKLNSAATRDGGISDLNKQFTLANGGMALLTGKVNGLDDAFKLLGQQNVFTGLDEQLTGTNSLTGKVKEQFRGLDQAIVNISKTSAPQAQAAFQQVAAAAERNGTSLDTLVGQFKGYADQTRAQAEAQGITIDSTEKLVTLMKNGVPDAQKAAGKATDSMTTSLEDQAKAAEDATKAQRDLASLMLSLSGSLIGLEASYDSATEALKENGRTHDLNTEKGRANQAALNDIAASWITYSENADKANTSEAEMSANMDRSREKFVAHAIAIGYDATAAAALAEQYFKMPVEVATNVKAVGIELTSAQVSDVQKVLSSLPSSVQTAISTPGATLSKEQAAQVQEALKKIDPITLAAIKTEANTRGVTVVQEAVDYLRRNATVTVYTKPELSGIKGLADAINGLNRVVTVEARLVISQYYGQIAGVTGQGGMTRKNGGYIGGAAMSQAYATPAHIGAPGFAGGGGWTGLGPRRVDRIPAWLAAHEFVHQDKAVDYYGLSVMEALNQQLIPREAFSPFGFANGGSPARTVVQAPRLVTTPMGGGTSLTTEAIAAAVRAGLSNITVIDRDGTLIGTMRVQAGLVQSGAVSPLNEGRAGW